MNELFQFFYNRNRIKLTDSEINNLLNNKYIQDITKEFISMMDARIRNQKDTIAYAESQEFMD